jgi:hypothetical protein
LTPKNETENPLESFWSISLELCLLDGGVSVRKKMKLIKIYNLIGATYIARLPFINAAVSKPGLKARAFNVCNDLLSKWINTSTVSASKCLSGILRSWFFCPHRGQKIFPLNSCVPQFVHSVEV